jgi:hypothetical protein
MTTLLLLSGLARAQDPAAPAPAAPAAPAEPVAPPADAVDPSQDAALQALRAELEAQQRRLAEHEEALAEAQARLEALADAQVQAPAPAKTPFVTLDFEGHYRVRGESYAPLFAREKNDPTFQAFTRQRLWLRPRFSFGEVGKLWVEVRALEDVVFGDNAQLASTPLFAGDSSSTDLEGNEVPSIVLGRVWGEIKLPVGVFRAGRIPSQWGMGLLVAPGEGFDQPFGEAYYPTTNDRLLFATRPLAIASRILGTKDTEIPLFFAFAVDRLVEDPLYQYFGYRCTPGLVRGDSGFDPRCDGNGDGLTDQDHSFVSETPSARSADWWTDPEDDVVQTVYVLTYQGNDIRYLGDQGDLSGGFWVVNRRQRETDSNVLIVDGTARAHVHDVLVEGEFVSITGGTRALTLPAFDRPNDPLKKQAAITGYAARAGWSGERLDALVETGFASGDEDVTDSDFTGRPLHPDHNVGLLIYEQVLAQVTAAVRTDAARGLWSNGAVYSSRYLNPVVTVRPKDGLSLVAGFVTAWPDRPDGAVLRCRSSDAVGCDSPESLQATSDSLGWEVDAAVKVDWARAEPEGPPHLRWSLESGYAKVTDRIPVDSAGLNPDGTFFTLQSRLAWVF